MSDKQRDREERQHVIEVLKSWDGYFIGYTSDEVQEALRYVIASIKTDLKYDLLYEETIGQADKPTIKNDVPDINVGKIESTTKDYLGVDYLGVDAVSRQALIDWLTNWTLGDATPLIDFVNSMPSVTPQLSSGLDKNSKKLEKDFGESDCISREQALRELKESAEHHANDSREEVLLRRDRDIIRALPSVTLQEPKTGYCKNCKFFELNSWAACGGIPIIVAHEICKAWGNGCKTKEDGYCFLFEPKESEG